LRTSSDHMPIIQVDHVTKEYKLGQLKSLKQTALNSLNRLTGRPVEDRKPFKALDDVSFTVEQGEVLGIIGHNGAGKSTMLKLLANISKPSCGSIIVKGKVAPLIEVGAGLVGDLTGRENIYLNGAILGISKAEITRKFGEIVAFAELEEFIDTPIKRYSSGMSVRLGFAIATSVESDILIVDEVLAVGDLAFQRKCFDRIDSLINTENRTVLVVSHNLRQIERLCKRVILLRQGKVVADGEPKAVCNQMFEEMDSKIASQATQNSGKNTGPMLTDGSLELIDIALVDTNGKKTNSLEMGSDATLKVRYNFHHRLTEPIFGIGIHTNDFIYLTTEQSYGRLNVDFIEPGIHELSFKIKTIPLLPGIYSFRLGVARGQSGGASFYKDNALHFQVTANNLSRSWNTAPDEGFFALNAEWALSS
jgi:lipopolysaccharide transport system ATP-binding protein